MAIKKRDLADVLANPTMAREVAWVTALEKCRVKNGLCFGFGSGESPGYSLGRREDAKLCGGGKGSGYGDGSNYVSGNGAKRLPSRER